MWQSWSSWGSTFRLLADNSCSSFSGSRDTQQGFSSLPGQQRHLWSSKKIINKWRAGLLWRNSESVTCGGGGAAYLQFFKKPFSFEVILNLRKSPRNGAKSSHRPLHSRSLINVLPHWLHLYPVDHLLMFCHIGFICLPTLRRNFFLPEPFESKSQTSCLFAPNTSVYIF